MTNKTTYIIKWKTRDDSASDFSDHKFYYDKQEAQDKAREFTKKLRQEIYQQSGMIESLSITYCIEQIKPEQYDETQKQMLLSKNDLVANIRY